MNRESTQSSRRSLGIGRRTRLHRIASLLSVASLPLVAIGCVERAGEEQLDPVESADGGYDLSFTPPDPGEGRRHDTVIAVDLDNDGRPEQIATSIAPLSFMPDVARADRVTIWRFDTASRSWKALLADTTIFWGARYRLDDLTGDRVPELIVDVESGGNDPVASRGMRVFSGHGGEIRTIFSSDDGNPIVEEIEEIPLPAIVVHDLLWPELVPHVQAHPYVRDVMIFDGNSMTAVRETNQTYFRKRSRRFLDRYANVLKVTPLPDSGMALPDTIATALFLPAAQAVIALSQAGEHEMLRRFWETENEALRQRLPEEQYDQLEELYAERQIGKKVMSEGSNR